MNAENTQSAASVSGQLAVYNFETFPVRVTDREGNPWFVAHDVCKAIRINNSRMAVARLDDDERADVSLTDVSSMQKRKYNIVSESGLYALILRSDKPEARKFRKWVTGEVLPAIRRQGFYEACEATVPSAPEKKPLIQTVVDMLRSLNERITAREDIPPHILKYAWNLANVSRDAGIRNQAFNLMRERTDRTEMELAAMFIEEISGAIDGAKPLPGMPEFDSDGDRVFLRTRVVDHIFAGKLQEAGRNPIGTLRRLVNGGFIDRISPKVTKHPHHATPLMKRANGLLWNPDMPAPVRVLDVRDGKIVEIERD